METLSLKRGCFGNSSNFCRSFGIDFLSKYVFESGFILGKITNFTFWENKEYDSFIIVRIFSGGRNSTSREIIVGAFVTRSVSTFQPGRGSIWLQVHTQTCLDTPPSAEHSVSFLKLRTDFLVNKILTDNKSCRQLRKIILMPVFPCKMRLNPEIG